MTFLAQSAPAQSAVAGMPARIGGDEWLDPPRFAPMTCGDYLLRWYDANCNAKDRAGLASQAAE